MCNIIQHHIRKFLKSNVMRKYFIVVVILMIHCCGFSQIILNSQSNQSIRINQDITFSGNGGTLTLKKMAIETSGTITFTDSIVNLEDVTINCGSMVDFKKSTTNVRIINVVDISCKSVKLPASLLVLQGIDSIKGKPTTASPAFTLRFESLAFSPYHISSDHLLSFSMIIK